MPSKSVDLYKVLDVPSSASFDDIKSSFLKKAKETHPDKETGSAEQFQIVNNAYEVLSDPVKRATYNRESGVTQHRNSSTSRHVYRNKGYGARGNFHQANTTGRTEYNIKYGAGGFETEYDIGGIHIIQKKKNTEQTAHQKHFEKKLRQQKMQKPRVKTHGGRSGSLIGMLVGTMLVTAATIKIAGRSKHRR